MTTLKMYNTARDRCNREKRHGHTRNILGTKMNRFEETIMIPTTTHIILEVRIKLSWSEYIRDDNKAIRTHIQLIKIQLQTKTEPITSTNLTKVSKLMELLGVRNSRIWNEKTHRIVTKPRKRRKNLRLKRKGIN
jgi:hypothetical protein